LLAHSVLLLFMLTLSGLGSLLLTWPVLFTLGLVTPIGIHLAAWFGAIGGPLHAIASFRLHHTSRRMHSTLIWTSTFFMFMLLSRGCAGIGHKDQSGSCRKNKASHDRPPLVTFISWERQQASACSRPTRRNDYCA
jgi:hypothetical protein